MAKADRSPKKIAGLKLPKNVRQSPAIRSLLATPAGRKILDDALIEGAAFAAARVMEAKKSLLAKTAKPAPKAKKPAPAPAPKQAAFGAPLAKPAPAPVKAAGFAAAPPKPPASSPEPFKSAAPPAAKPAVEPLDDLDDGLPGKSSAAE